MHVQAHGGLHWRTLSKKNATDCGVRGRLLWAAAEKGSGTHLRLVKGRNVVLFSGFCGFLIVLFTSKTKWQRKNGFSWIANFCRWT